MTSLPSNPIDRMFGNSRRRLSWCCSVVASHTPLSRAFSQMLDASGVKHVFKETDGAHTWLNWRRYLAEVAPQLFPQS